MAEVKGLAVLLVVLSLVLIAMVMMDKKTKNEIMEALGLKKEAQGTANAAGNAANPEGTPTTSP